MRKPNPTTRKDERWSNSDEEQAAAPAGRGGEGERERERKERSNPNSEWLTDYDVSIHYVSVELLLIFIHTIWLESEEEYFVFSLCCTSSLQTSSTGRQERAERAERAARGHSKFNCRGVNIGTHFLHEV